MKDALTIVHREHVNLRALLSCLESLVDDMEHRGMVPDLSVFALIFNYLGSYLDRYHHPKEDAYLFKALRQRDPEAGAIIDASEEQHRQEPSMLAKVRTALDDYSRNGASAMPRFRSAIRGYVEFERNHAMMEEEQVFQRAKETLTEEDWAEIDAAFQSNDDPLFGDEPTQRFRSLFTEISARVPAPHGLARSWPKQARRPAEVSTRLAAM